MSASARFGELEDQARDMEKLSSVLFDDGDASGRPGQVVGEVLWATLRGLVTAQMLSPLPIDSTRERALLVDLLTGLLDGTPA